MCVNDLTCHENHLSCHNCQRLPTPVLDAGCHFLLNLYIVHFLQPELIVDPIEYDMTKSVFKAEEIRDEGPILTDKAPLLKEEITREEIDALDKAIGNITKEKEKSLGKTKSELDDLREDLVEYQQV